MIKYKDIQPGDIAVYISNKGERAVGQVLSEKTWKEHSRSKRAIEADKEPVYAVWSSTGEAGWMPFHRIVEVNGMDVKKGDLGRPTSFCSHCHCHFPGLDYLCPECRE